MPSYSLAPALAVLRDNQLNLRYPERDKASDGWIGDASHSARVSDHNPDWSAGGIVRALDIDEDLDGKSITNRPGVAQWLADALTTDPRTRYVIYEGRIWTNPDVYASGAGYWREYTGTNAHLHHIHLSVRHGETWDHDETAWPIGESMATFTPPLVGAITSDYGMRTYPITGQKIMHRGLDIASRGLSDEVRAPFRSRVRALRSHHASTNPITGSWNSGSYVLLERLDGSGKFDWLGHLRLIYVDEGWVVDSGTVVGLEGDVGNVTGKHLHWEVWSRYGGQYHTDPKREYTSRGLVPGGAAITAAQKKALSDLGYATVKAYQEDNGLVPDGALGPVTASHLEDTMAKIDDVLAAAKAARKAAEAAQRALLIVDPDTMKEKSVGPGWFSRMAFQGREAARAAAAGLETGHDKDTAADQIGFILEKVARLGIVEVFFTTKSGREGVWWPQVGEWALAPDSDAFKRHLDAVAYWLGWPNQYATIWWGNVRFPERKEILNGEESIVQRPEALGTRREWVAYTDED